MKSIKHGGLLAAFLLLCHPSWSQDKLALSLSDCRHAAAQHSEDLAKSQNAVAQAELDRKIAATYMLPSIQGSATGLYVLPDIDMMGVDLLMRGTYMAGINLVQPVYAGGKIAAGRQLAKIGEKVAAEKHRLAVMDVIENADNAYWTLMAVEEKVKMLQAYKAQMDTLYNQTKQALNVGMATENDLLRIGIHYNDMNYQLQRATNGWKICHLLLCNTIGVDPATELVLTDTVFDIELPPTGGADIQARPELALMQAQVDAGHQNIKRARADFLPTVGLSLGYTYFGNVKIDGEMGIGPLSLPISQEFKQGIGVALLSVKIPVFHWGEGSKKIKKAKLELNNAELDLAKNSRMMDVELQQAVNNLNDSYLLIETAKDGLKQAEENLRVARHQYEADMLPLSDLLDAQSQWQSAASNLIEAQTQYMIYHTRYLRVTGRLDAVAME